MQLACAPFLTGALTVAARAGIADLLQAGPLTVEELAAATGLQAAVLLRILRVLASVQIFQRLDDSRFENNDASERLRDSHPASMRHFCILAGTEYYRAFGDIMHTAQTGESAFRHTFGGSIYSYMDENPEAGRIYDRAMEDLTAPVGRHLAVAYDFGAVHSVADIGGGSGVLLKEILRSHPVLHATCFDRKDACARGRRRAADSAENGLAGRLTFVAGDFFAEIPAGHDVYILKNVLHNWNDESSVKILNVVRAAMKPQARLLVVEPLIENDCAHTSKLVNDLFQMVVCEQGTTARTQEQMQLLLHRAGYAPLDVIPLSTGHQVMICAPQTAATWPVGESNEAEEGKRTPGTKNKLAISSPSDESIILTRVFEAAQDLVFDAFTRPENVAQWHGRGPHGTVMMACDIDFRQGGSWRFSMCMPTGTEMTFSGVYQEIDAPKRIVSTECFVEHSLGNPEWLSTITFEEDHGKTTLTNCIQHPSKESRDAHLKYGLERAASDTFDRVEEFLLKNALGPSVDPDHHDEAAGFDMAEAAAAE